MNVTIFLFGVTIASTRNKALQIHWHTALSTRLGATRPTQQCESTDDAGANLVVLGLGVAVTPELRRLTEQRSTEPWAVSLPLVCDDLYLQTTTLGASAACF